MSFRSGSAILFLTSVIGAPSWADDRAEVAPVTTRPGVLVFRSGRVVEGEIAETETHYVVVRPIGRVEVPKSDVETVARDLDEVYRAKAARLNDRDPDEHMKLAHWCLQVNLRERAILELERAADLSGNPAKPQGMIAALRRAAESAAKPRAKPTAAEIIERLAPTPMPERQPTEQELTPPTISKFTTQIQPLLTRSCGTVGCHDTAHAGPLALERFARPNQRTTQINLRAVLSVIDADDPDASPLITQAARPHPRGSAGETSVALRDAAFTTLVEWTRGAAGYRSSDALPTQARSPSAAEPVESRDEPPMAEPAAATTAPAPAETNTVPADLAAQPNIVRSNQPFIRTPSRARAGMTHAPPLKSTKASADRESSATANGAAASTPNRPSSSPAPALADGATLVKKNAAARPVTDVVPQRAGRPAASNAPGLPTNAAQAGQNTATSGAIDRKPAADFQPIDEFDPEIFNRQFAPRDAGPRP